MKYKTTQLQLKNASALTVILYIIVVTSIFAFMAVIGRVYQFSFIITSPINRLTAHINDYK